MISDHDLILLSTELLLHRPLSIPETSILSLSVRRKRVLISERYQAYLSRVKTSS